MKAEDEACACSLLQLLATRYKIAKSASLKLGHTCIFTSCIVIHAVTALHTRWPSKNRWMQKSSREQPPGQVASRHQGALMLVHAHPSGLFSRLMGSTLAIRLKADRQYSNGCLMQPCM